MEKSEKKLLERDIYKIILDKLQFSGLLVIQELRLHPCEIDLVLFDPDTLQLAAIEIKRSKWKELLQQSVRDKLYCHFSFAVMPVSMRRSVPLKLFKHFGIGVLFYREEEGNIDLYVSHNATRSDSINRSLKQQIYKHFCQRYGDTLYA